MHGTKQDRIMQLTKGDDSPSLREPSEHRDTWPMPDRWVAVFLICMFIMFGIWLYAMIACRPDV